MVVIWTDHAALTWVQKYHQSDNMFIRWIVELSWYKPWKILHVAGKLNEVAGSLSRKREEYPEQQQLFDKRHPCKLGECPHCKFHNAKLERCRGEDSDDSDDPTKAIPQPLTSGEVLATGLADLRWEFAEHDVDSDVEEGEEPEFVNSVDFNLYLTRRLHDHAEQNPPEPERD
jgi:glutaredoxin